MIINGVTRAISTAFNSLKKNILSATNVQDAIDEVSTKLYKDVDKRLSELEGKYQLTNKYLNDSVIMLDARTNNLNKDIEELSMYTHDKITRLEEKVTELEENA